MTRELLAYCFLLIIFLLIMVAEIRSSDWAKATTALFVSSLLTLIASYERKTEDKNGSPLATGQEELTY